MSESIKTVATTPRQWKVVQHGDQLNIEGPCTSICKNIGEIDEQAKADFALIVRSVNLLAAHEAVAVMAEKLRLSMNPLLVELPDKSIVNGKDNFPFRLKILKLQVEAEKALSDLANLKAQLLTPVSL